MAGNARFHDKLHRKNHHTNPTVGYADSASDPIASPSEPFQGDFVINGKLSSSKGISILSANITNDIYCNNIRVSGVTYTNYISGDNTQVIISDKETSGFGDNTLNLDFKKSIYNRVNNNTIMYLASSNVGIMTTSPRNTLDVLGNVIFQATDSTSDTGLLTLIKPNSSYNSNDLEIKTYGSWAAGTPNNTSGGIKIKSAGGSFTSPSQTLSGRLGYIVGASTHDGVNWKNSSAINFGLEENALIDNQLSYISFETLSGGYYSNRKEAMRISPSGNVKIVMLSGTGNRAVYSDANGNLTNTSSDGTLKENIFTISQGLTEILKLNPVSFNWKDTEKYGDQREIGFIAQEVQSIIPEVIGKNANGTLSLDYSKMISVLTKSIQELNAKVDAQAAEINALKSLK